MLVTPFTTVAQENKESNNVTDKPDAEGLVAQIRTVIIEVLQKYGHIPNVRNPCNAILNKLDSIGLILFCISILVVELPIIILFIIFETLGITKIWYPLGQILFILFHIFDSNCNELIPPFKSIYSLSETKDINNLANDCPCLQE